MQRSLGKSLVVAWQELKRRIDRFSPDALRNVARIVAERHVEFTNRPVQIDLDAVREDIIRRLEALLRREKILGALPVAPDLSEIRSDLLTLTKSPAKTKCEVDHSQIAILDEVRPINKQLCSGLLK